jgi:ribose/xylose/arabinose/galactoside ABC-type transport system permease subunit
VTGLLAGVLAMMLPGWNLGGYSGFVNFQAQMAGVMLLPALGMVLALRKGAIDLGVWGVMGLGGVTAATLINAGWTPTGAFAVAIAAGACLGLAAGVVSAWVRLPSPLVTVATGGAAVALCHWIAPGVEAVTVPEAAFEPWKEAVIELALSGEGDGSDLEIERIPAVLLTRMLFVGACWGAVMLLEVLLAGGAWEGGSRQRRIGLAGSLALSGALAAAGGAAWLIDHGSAPVPESLVGDLRIPAAAILSGALVCTGGGRALLAGVWLPLSLLAATMWRQQTFYFEAGGYELQLIALVGEALLAQLAMRRLVDRQIGRRVIRAATACALGSLLVFGLSGQAASPTVRAAMQYLSLALAGVGTVLLVADVLIHRRAGRSTESAAQ